MKKLFSSLVFVALMIVAGTLFATEVVQPTNVPDDSAFQVNFEDAPPCLLKITVSDGTETSWIKYFTNGEESPFILQKHTYDNGNLFWVDSKRTGKFDEYFPSLEAMKAKYPKPCDAVAR